jgi:FkbM family methyltransferase
MREKALRKSVVRWRDVSIGRAPWLRRTLQLLASRGVVPRAVWRRIQPLGACRIVTPSGRRFIYVGTSGDMLAREFVWTNARDYEYGTFRLVGALAPTVSCFLNVGTHTGLFPMLVATENPRARAIVIEPNPATFVRLSGNIAINHMEDRIDARNIALSDHAGKAVLYVPEYSARASLDAEFNATASCAEIAVTLEVGDEVCEAFPTDLMLIDVEGHEGAVLRGLAATIDRAHPTVLVEVQLGDVSSLMTIRTTLGAHGCDLGLHIGDDGQLRDAGAPFPWTATAQNFLFVHPSNRDHVLDLLRRLGMVSP